MDKVYHTKIDWWIALILASAVVITSASGVALLVNLPADGFPAILIAVASFAVAAFVAWIPFSTYYTITSADLLVRSACFRWRIPLDRIVEVFPTRNPLSSPACSLDRLRVNYKRASGRTWWVMISPKEKEQFLNDLAQAAGLEWQRNGSVRRG